MKLLRNQQSKSRRPSRREEALGVTSIDTIISAGVNVHGGLTSEGDIVIDGTVVGTIHAGGDVTIGVNGKIKAPIEAFNVSIAGEVEGTITAQGEVTIRETGYVNGDVTATGLTIASGGIFNGRNTVQQQREPNPPSGPQD